MGIIYKVTYKIDPNEIYIGQSVLSLEERRRQHERNPKVWQLPDDSFDKILLKKGLDNWKWEIIAKDLETKDELDRAEIKNIRLYNVKGYSLINKVHSPKIKSEIKNRINYGVVKAWDTENKKAHTARYLTGKIKPIINLSKNIKYKTIIELRDKEKISTPFINKLCKTGEPHPQTGNQYAFLDLENNPILNEGHTKSYPILQKIEMLDIKTGKNYRVNLFEATSITQCNLWELTKMKILNLGGKRNDITCNGYLFFRLNVNGERIETDKHKQILERAKLDRIDIYIWSWNQEKEKWEYLNRVKGYNQASEFLAHKLKIQKPSIYSTKIIEIIKGARTHLKGYSFTLRTEPPHQKPLRKLQPVIWLNSKDGRQIYFDNAKIAAEELGLDCRYIIACCNGKINMTCGCRFAWSNEKLEPIYTKQHENYLRKKTGLGMSVYWVEGEQAFQSIAALKRHLDNLCANNDDRVPYVPKAEKLSKIAKGELSGLLGIGDNKFKITLTMIR
jgi:hypothetical protein